MNKNNNELNEILINAIEKIITKKEIKEAIKEVVNKKVEYNLEYEIKKEAKNQAEEIANTWIAEQIDKVLNFETFTDDGWGNKRTYKNFEEFVKDEISKQIKSKNYNLEYKVKRVVEDKIKDICEKVVQENNDQLAEQVMKKLAKVEE